MSERSGQTAKGKDGKTKYASLNLFDTYKGKSLEAQKPVVPPRHGLQSLGKVASARRMPPPANLPSLKAENKGNDPNVSLVPKDGTGWASKQEPADPKSTDVLSTPQPESQQPAASQTPASTRPRTPPATEAPGSALAAGGRSWAPANVTHGAQGDGGKGSSRPSPFSREEFPTLQAAGDQDRAGRDQGTADQWYGPGPSLRPQNVTSWRDGGGRALTMALPGEGAVEGVVASGMEGVAPGGVQAPPPLQQQQQQQNASLPHGPPRNPPAGSPALPLPQPPVAPQFQGYRGIMPPFMYPPYLPFPPPYGPQGPYRFPPPAEAPRFSRSQGGAGPDGRSGGPRGGGGDVVKRPSILKQDDLKELDELDHDGDEGWADVGGESRHTPPSSSTSEEAPPPPSSKPGWAEEGPGGWGGQGPPPYQGRRTGLAGPREQPSPPPGPLLGQAPYPYYRQDRPSPQLSPSGVPGPPQRLSASPSLLQQQAPPPAGQQAPPPAAGVTPPPPSQQGEDEDETWRQRRKQSSSEISAAVERARRRREEEERRMEEERRAACAEKLKRLDEKQQQQQQAATGAGGGAKPADGGGATGPSPSPSPALSTSASSPATSQPAGPVQWVEAAAPGAVNRQRAGSNSSYDSNTDAQQCPVAMAPQPVDSALSGEVKEEPVWTGGAPPDQVGKAENLGGGGGRPSCGSSQGYSKYQKSLPPRFQRQQQEQLLKQQQQWQQQQHSQVAQNSLVPPPQAPQGPSPAAPPQSAPKQPPIYPPGSLGRPTPLPMNFDPRWMMMTPYMDPRMMQGRPSHMDYYPPSMHPSGLMGRERSDSGGSGSDPFDRQQPHPGPPHTHRGTPPMDPKLAWGEGVFSQGAGEGRVLGSPLRQKQPHEEEEGLKGPRSDTPPVRLRDGAPGSPSGPSNQTPPPPPHAPQGGAPHHQGFIGGRAGYSGFPDAGPRQQRGGFGPQDECPPRGGGASLSSSCSSSSSSSSSARDDVGGGKTSAGPPQHDEAVTVATSGRKQEKSGAQAHGHPHQQQYPKPQSQRGREHKTETQWGPRPGSNSAGVGGGRKSTNAAASSTGGGNSNTGGGEEPANQSAVGEGRPSGGQPPISKRAGPIKRPVLKEMKREGGEGEGGAGEKGAGPGQGKDKEQDGHQPPAKQDSAPSGGGSQPGSAKDEVSQAAAKPRNGGKERSSGGGGGKGPKEADIGTTNPPPQGYPAPTSRRGGERERSYDRGGGSGGGSYHHPAPPRGSRTGRGRGEFYGRGRGYRGTYTGSSGGGGTTRGRASGSRSGRDYRSSAATSAGGGGYHGNQDSFSKGGDTGGRHGPGGVSQQQPNPGRARNRSETRSEGSEYEEVPKRRRQRGSETGSESAASDPAHSDKEDRKQPKNGGSADGHPTSSTNAPPAPRVSQARVFTPRGVPSRRGRGGSGAGGGVFRSSGGGGVSGGHRSGSGGTSSASHGWASKPSSSSRKQQQGLSSSQPSLPKDAARGGGDSRKDKVADPGHAQSQGANPIAATPTSAALAPANPVAGPQGSSSENGTSGPAALPSANSAGGGNSLPNVPALPLPAPDGGRAFTSRGFERPPRRRRHGRSQHQQDKPPRFRRLKQERENARINGQQPPQARPASPSQNSLQDTEGNHGPPANANNNATNNGSTGGGGHLGNQTLNNSHHHHHHHHHHHSNHGGNPAGGAKSPDVSNQNSDQANEEWETASESSDFADFREREGGGGGRSGGGGGRQFSSHHHHHPARGGGGGGGGGGGEREMTAKESAANKRSFSSQRPGMERQNRRVNTGGGGGGGARGNRGGPTGGGGSGGGPGNGGGSRGERRANWPSPKNRK
ncbi:hypothetical protein AGOR_G00044400 [Albula goreensis]|uniref:BAT2 N-terminal domain-containing protein n=1 Tax=Albula goreensis TaxID=1534307 RepID=A0A8T3DZC3_9TELE|nr:hypothetical protein AGOR_G00044400 [Albula goreensis]